MLTYSLASSAARRARFDEAAPSKFNELPPRPEAVLRRIDSRFEDGKQRNSARVRPLLDGNIGNGSRRVLDIYPAHVVNRRAVAWDGIRVEIVQSVTRDRVEFRFCAPSHLLLVYEEAARDEGETLIDDLACSTLRTLTRKLTFVPAGHDFREWQRIRARARVICFYLDPAMMPIAAAASPVAEPLRPHVLFENTVLWETAVKLATAVEGGPEDERYAEALGVVVAHELLRIGGNAQGQRPPARGGLAVWQQRIVSAHIEEHLAESIPLATLAQLVRLSSFYFCRAFKRSFGVPPHRYQINRRIERAKALLTNPDQSVTDVALALGFSETSSFSTAFRQATGVTPTEYRRTL
jgi:AraC family transcriptional regulator